MAGVNQPVVRGLTRAEVPDNSLILWVSDVHIPIHHEGALGLMIEAAEAEGVTHVAAGGDILDCHCLMKRPKEADRILEAGTLLEEVEPGRWFLEWLATRPSWYLLGNHEDRLDRFIAEDALPLYGTAAAAIADLVQIPPAIEVLPSGSEIRLGNLALTHGHAEFGQGSGGKYPARRLLEMAPDQSTIAGHVHRMDVARRTSRDEHGVNRTRMAMTMGHMSREERHHQYAGKHPNWQMGFGFIRAWWDGPRPRWNVTPVEVMFNRRNRPYFEHGGRIYQ